MKWNKSNDRKYLQTHFLSHPAGQVIEIEKHPGSWTREAGHMNVLRLCRPICGKAPLFRSSPRNQSGYAAGPEAEPRHSLLDRTVKPSFTANRTAEPLQSEKKCPTKIAKTAEHLSEPEAVATGFSIPIPTKIAKTVEQVRKILGLVILVLGCYVTEPIFAQERPEPVLVDEFIRANCEETKARVDYLMTRVNSDPQLHGVIAINAKQNGLRSNLIYEEMLRGSMLIRRYSLDQLTFVRTYDKPEGEIRMWVVRDSSWRPPGSHGWDLTISADTKPFIVDTEWYYGDDVCPPTDGPKLLAELLNANPSARSNIVIRRGSRLLASKDRQRFVREMQKKYGLSKTRIRFFLAKRTRPLNSTSEPDTEFWFVPGKHK